MGSHSKWLLCEDGRYCPSCGKTLRYNTGKISNKLLCKSCNQLFDKIDEAYIKSKIPEEPSEEDTEELNKFLIGVRGTSIK